MARPVAWGFTNVGQPLVTTQRVSIDLLTDLTPSDMITLDRLIVHLNLFPGLGEFLIGVQSVYFGIGVVSVEAFAVANSVGLPNPATSDEIPPRGWLWSDKLSAFNDEGQTNADFIRFMPEVRLDFRAARKVDRGVLFLTMSSVLQFGAAFDVNVLGRIGALCLT